MQIYFNIHKIIKKVFVLKLQKRGSAVYSAEEFLEASQNQIISKKTKLFFLITLQKPLKNQPYQQDTHSLQINLKISLLLKSII